MPTSKRSINRRDFIGHLSCAAVGSTTFFSTLFNLQSLNAAAWNNRPALDVEEDYRALVCIMLGGGNDSFNMLAPVDAEHYQDYRNSRSNMALERHQFLSLAPENYNLHQLGLHPAMAALKAHFDQGNLAVICNVGTLVQPTVKSDFFSGNNLPMGLFSHADQDKQWQTSVPQTVSSTGWGGRLADLVYEANTNQQISMNISLAGKNIFQLGRHTAEYSILPTGDGSRGITAYNGTSSFDKIRRAAVQSLMEQQYQDIFKSTYADIVTASQNTHELFSQAISDTAISSSFSNTDLAQRLKMVARTIHSRQRLGLKRQTFFVRFDGWDHHDELLSNHNQMLGILSEAMSEFQQALQELNIADKVTTFTISDFARTLTSNGNGTDHAWGGNVMVMGEAVKGKEIYGKYPRLVLDESDDIGGGVIIPGISTDEYFAELALWYGVSPGDLPLLFPNIGNFYSPTAGSAPLGFMMI